MIIVSESAQRLKSFIHESGLGEVARQMAMRMVLAFVMHRGRMSCSAAAGAIASHPVHRGELTRFLARPRWQKRDFHQPLLRMLLAKEKKRGKFLFIIDATLVTQAGKKTQNTYLKGNRRRRPAKWTRYNKKKIVYKKLHSFTFGLLITPLRISTGDAQLTLNLASFLFFLEDGYVLNVFRMLDITQIWSTLVIAQGAHAIDSRRSFGSAAAILLTITLLFIGVVARFV